jgi:mannitol-1-/sugar-/sorbitol-6-phosphatase
MIELTIVDGGRRHESSCAAVLFDMDGTLVDSTICVERTWRTWASRHGLDVQKLLNVAHGRQNREVIRMVAPHLETADELSFLTSAEEDCREGIVAVAGARNLLDLLPFDRWAVVTSAWKKLAEIRLSCAGLPIPDVLITADEIERSKPDPAGYLAAAARLNVEPSSCLVIEDTRAGIEAAIAAGMMVLGITTTFGREQLGCEWCISDFRSISVKGFGSAADES